MLSRKGAQEIVDQLPSDAVDGLIKAHKIFIGIGLAAIFALVADVAKADETAACDAGAAKVQAALSGFVHDNKIEKVRTLLEAGVRPTSIQLFDSVANNRPQMMRELMQAGAKPTQEMIDNASAYNRPQLVRELTAGMNKS